MQDILTNEESTQKINFLIDEYDGEDLDESEAIRLNEILNGPLKGTFILLIVQPIENSELYIKLTETKTGLIY